MAMTLAPYGSKEILRYARIRQPRIIDIVQRARASAHLRAIVDKPSRERLSWAREQLKSRDCVRSAADLGFGYLAHLTLTALPGDRLPSREAVRDPKAFAATVVASDRHRRKDVDNCLASLLAFKILKDEEQAAIAAKLLSFVELFPNLPSTVDEGDYPVAVLTRIEVKAAPLPTEPDNRPAEAAQRATDISSLARNVQTLWTARNRMVTSQRRELDGRYNQIMAPSMDRADRKSGGTAKTPKARRKAASVALTARINARRRGLAALQADALAADKALTLGDVLELPAKQLAAGAAASQLAAIQRDTRVLLEKYAIPAADFAETFRQVGTRADAVGVSIDKVAGAMANDATNPSCYRENPRLMFSDSARLLGHADLVRVDETFVKYSPGEISYIENILPGEVKKRKVRSTKYFEEVTESVGEQTTDTSSESSSTTKQDLGSQVATELATRMNSQMSATASGSGGGTIGVVDFQAAGTASANLGLGVDSSVSTQNTSNFSQEIISKAVEKTKTTSIERRMTRSYSLYETLHSHEVNNALGDEIKARNGIYCFLDKHVCLTETVYGKRLFVLANLRTPGRNLLCARERRLQLGLSELGHRPTFDLTVDQIQPGTYKTLVSQYKAAHVSPPPPLLQTISRTYKTDNTNANPEKQGIDLPKIASALSPFFEQYKRFLVTENVRLPEGYQVLEATATVNHGRNGISVPAHLPLKVAGAAIGAGVTAAAAVASGSLAMLLLPVAAGQFEYGIAPLLNYNCDSSNVSLCLGTETQDSPYFFFDPGFLMDEILHAFEQFLQNTPGLVDRVQAAATSLVDQLNTRASQVPQEIADLVQRSIDDLVNNIKSALSSLYITHSIKDGLVGTFGDLRASLIDLTKLQDLQDTLGTLFGPLKDFIDEVIGIFRDGLASTLTDLFTYLAFIKSNSQTLPFYEVAGLRGELPVSINAVALNPGITVNVVATLTRTEETLDKWRLETFDALYQAYLQQLADYESKAMMLDKAERVTTSPARMRKEEATAVKELVLYALNNLHGQAGSDYSFDKINFLENAFDWENMSFRLFNYGPNAVELDRAKRGVFGGLDERRQAFLQAGWAQVLIPAQADPRLEAKVGQYFADGTFDLEGGFTIDELTALYQELANDRARIANGPIPTPIGHEVLPTDLIYIQDELPANPDSPCLQPG